MFAKSGPLPGLHKGASLHEEFAPTEADLGSATYPGAATPTALFSATTSTMTLWLHAVDDNTSGSVVLSAEGSTGFNKGTIYVARVDPTTATDLESYAITTDATTEGWHAVLSYDDADLALRQYIGSDGSSYEFGGIADHWHVYAHGFHWIVASLLGNSESPERGTSVGLVMLTFTVDAYGVPSTPFKAFFFYPTTDTKSSSTTTAGAVYYNDTDLTLPLGGTVQLLVMATNDMCMVADPEGVTVAAAYFSVIDDGSGGGAGTQGQILFHLSLDSASTGATSLSGYTLLTSGEAAGTTSGSSLSRQIILDARVPSRVNTFLAPTTLSPDVAGNLRWVRVDDTWVYKDGGTILAASSTLKENYSMAMRTPVSGWFDAIVYRYLPEGASDDLGSIHVMTLQRASFLRFGGSAPWTDTLTDAGARPHVLAWNGSLIVCWDDLSAVYMTVYTIT